MRKITLLLPLVALAVTLAPPPTAAKEADAPTAAGGVASGAFRYVALPVRGNGHSVPQTIVERIDRDGGRVDRWWRLPGSWVIPATAYDRSGGALAAGGAKLVLTSVRWSPRRHWSSRFAILDTNVYLRHPRRSASHRPRHAVRRIALGGTYFFHAISPDGSTLYLAHPLEPQAAGPGPAFNIRRLDVRSGHLLPRPVEGPPAGLREGPAGRLRLSGFPVASVQGEGWRYTYYDDGRGGRNPYVLALDLVRGEATTIEFPRLRERRDPMLVKLRLEPGDDWLQVLAASPRYRLLPKTSPLARVPVPPVSSAQQAPRHRFLAFAETPRHPAADPRANVLERVGVVGHSREGRQIRLKQLGDPALPGHLLIFGCIHGDECAAQKLDLVANGCPDPRADIFFVPNLNPDGFAAATRDNARGVDLNRNFGSQWRPIGRPGSPQYSGAHPFSEPEARLAARIVHRLRPRVTVWFHQHYGSRPFVRAWGQSAPAARFLARRARIPFHLIRWPAGTAPNWQNHRFAGASSFVVELPRGPIPSNLYVRLDKALVGLGRKVSQD
jgi:murein peptide amidase A